MFNKQKRQEAKANKEFLATKIKPRATFAQMQEKKAKVEQRESALQRSYNVAADHLREVHSTGRTDDVLQLGSDLLYLTALSGIQFKLEDQVGDIYHVASRWTAYGKHDGDFMGLAPTGRDITIAGLSLSTLSKGSSPRVTQEFHYWDVTAVLQQIQYG
jgi:predicted ester cyclase